MISFYEVNGIGGLKCSFGNLNELAFAATPGGGAIVDDSELNPATLDAIARHVWAFMLDNTPAGVRMADVDDTVKILEDDITRPIEIEGETRTITLGRTGGVTATATERLDTNLEEDEFITIGSNKYVAHPAADSPILAHSPYTLSPMAICLGLGWPVVLARDGSVPQPVDVVRLGAALDQLVQRHEAFRTGFDDVAGMPEDALSDRVATMFRSDGNDSAFRQYVHASAQLALAVEQLGSGELTNLHALEPATAQRIADDISRAFDYSQPPLLRATLLCGGGPQALLSIVVHHLIADRISLDVLTEELDRLYSGDTLKSQRTAAPGTQCAYLALEQRRLAQEGHYEAPTAYWRGVWEEHLESVFRSGDMTGAVPPVLGRVRTRLRRLSVDSAIAEGLRRAARRGGVTIYMFGLAVTLAALSRYTNRPHVAILSTLGNRQQLEVKRAVGWFSELYLVGVDTQRQSSPSDVLDGVRHAVLGGIEHQGVPFGYLWTRLASAEHLTTATSVDDCLIFEHVRMTVSTASAAAVVSKELDLVDIPGRESRTPFCLSLVENAFGAYELVLVYPEGVPIEEVDRLLAHWRGAAESFADTCLRDTARVGMAGEINCQGAVEQ